MSQLPTVRLSNAQVSTYLHGLLQDPELRLQADAAWAQAREFIELARAADLQRWLQPLRSAPGPGHCALEDLFAGNLQFKVRAYALREDDLERIREHAEEFIAPLQAIANSSTLCMEHYQTLSQRVNDLLGGAGRKTFYSEICKVAATLQPEVLVLILPKEKLFAVYRWLIEHIGLPEGPERWDRDSGGRLDWYQCSYILCRYLRGCAGAVMSPYGVTAPVYALRLREDITALRGAPLLGNASLAPDEQFVRRLREHLERSRNLILYGAPGTGKSYYAQQVMRGGTVFVTTFHPGYDYCDFVGSYQPLAAADGDGRPMVTYAFVPQIFLRAYTAAWMQWLDYLEHRAQDPGSDPRRVFLDIEEINRGNCARIFGDVFQLLDRDQDGYSRYKIDVGHDCAACLRQLLGEHLGVHLQAYVQEMQRLDDAGGQHDHAAGSEFTSLRLPPNLYLLATMNTSDQSLFPMDSAFKRRWDWEYVAINYRRADDVYVDVSRRYYRWSDFLASVNERVSALTMSEDKLLGPYFIAADQYSIISFDDLRGKVFFYLWDEIYRHEMDNADSIFRYHPPVENAGNGSQPEADAAGEDSVTFSRLFDEDGEQVMAYILCEQLGLREFREKEEKE